MLGVGSPRTSEQRSHDQRERWYRDDEEAFLLMLEVLVESRGVDLLGFSSLAQVFVDSGIVPVDVLRVFVTEQSRVRLDEKEDDVDNDEQAERLGKSRPATMEVCVRQRA